MDLAWPQDGCELIQGVREGRRQGRDELIKMNHPRVWPWADLVGGGGLGLCGTPWSGPRKGQRAVLLVLYLSAIVCGPPGVGASITHGQEILQA